MFSARNCSETETDMHGNKENQENSENLTPVRTRKLWVDCEPYTPPSQEPAVDTQITLKLTHFAKKPIIDFGSCKINKEVVRDLVIDNNNCYDVDVLIERFPFKKNFNISKRQFTIDANSIEVLTITWVPKDPGNYRELGMVNYEGFRLQFLMLGTVKEKPVKRRRRPLRAMTQQQNVVQSTAKPAIKEEIINRFPCTTKQEFQLGSIVQSPQTIQSEPAQSSPVETKALSAAVSPTNKENENSLQTPPTVKKIPSSSKPDFEYFQFKDHLQQSLGRPTFVVSQTPPSELPAYCGPTMSKVLPEASQDTTPTGRPTFLVSDTPTSELPQSSVEQGDSLEDFDTLIRSFHERVCRQNSAGDATELAPQNSTQILNTTHADPADSHLNNSLHSNTSTATYVVGDNAAESLKTGSKRKSDLCPSPPKKQLKSPKLQALRRKSCGTPGKNTRRKTGSGTPKGKTIQKLRASKSGRSSFPSPRKLSYKKSSTANMESQSSSRSNKLSKVVKQPTLAGTKRAAVIEAKKPTKKKLAKGVPMAHLVLRSESNVPQQRHPLTYASRNQFFDAKWRVKQERALACWANYVLTPDEFKPTQSSSEKPVADISILSSAAKVEPAMSKEMASLRAYQIGCRLNSLRRAACNLFHSANISTIIHKVEQEVDTGRLKVRSDRPLWKDLGCRHKLLQLLMNFHSIWLRLGLEVVFGEMIPIAEGQHHPTILSRFIKHRVLHDDDISDAFAHPTVPHSYRPGFEDELGKHTLKKIFVLIYVLDQAKKARLIDHDPCLFEKGASITSCREVLINIAREFLSGEGDVIKHLGYIGYLVSHQQSYLDEFEYGVNNIAVDMRNGIRLTRMIEILFHDWNLSSKLRTPPGSILQKRHNIGVAIKALESHGISVKDDKGKLITTEHIVHGNQDKTLSLIWNIAAHFQLVNAVESQHVEKEIMFLDKTLKLKQRQLGSNTIDPVLETNADEEDTAVEKTSALLLKWCKYVCAHHNIEVHNFVNSFADGRVLATLISHYQPQLLPPNDIRTETTMHMWEQQTEMQTRGNQSSRESYNQLTKNEKANFLMVKRAAYELGGIPSLMCVNDFCGTIPDSKVVRLLVAFLCTRLIDVRVEDQAARIIQISWNNFITTRKEREENKRKRENEKKAANIISSSIRAWICRKRYLAVKNACTAIQRLYRNYKATKTARQEFITKRSAAIKIQSLFRMILAKLFTNKVRKELILTRTYNQAAIVVQRAWRRILEQRARQNAAVKIQAWFRSIRQQKYYLRLQRSTHIIQQHWRAHQAGRQQREFYTKLQKTTVYLQSCVRRQLASKRYIQLRNATVVIQSHWRGVKQHRQFVTLKSAACVLQGHWRSCLLARQCRNYFQILRSSAIKIQTAYRSYLKRKKRCQDIKRQAAVKIQAKWKSHLQRREFLQKKECAVLIQTCWKGFLQRQKFRKYKNTTELIQEKWRATMNCRKTRKQFLHLREVVIKMQALRKSTVQRRRFLAYKNAIITLQAYIRGWLAKKQYHKLKLELQQKKIAAVRIQSAWRGYRVQRCYDEIRNAAVIIQRYWKATIFARQQRANFLKLKKSCLLIQSYYQGYVARKNYSRLKNASVIIQQHWKATTLARKQNAEYQNLKRSCIKIQKIYRGYIARKHYHEFRSATVIIQQYWKATLLANTHRKHFLQLRKSCIQIQFFYRGYIARRSYLAKKNASIIIQRHWKSTVLARKQRKDFLFKKKSCVKIQSCYRGYIAKQKYTCKKSAAIVIQQHWKATILATKQRKHFQQLKKSCVKIQSYCRGYIARQRYLAKKNSAIIFQQRWRAMSLAKKQRSAFLQIKQSCLLIQSHYRGFVARRNYCRLKKASVIIQHHWRATTLARKQNAEYQDLKNSCIKIKKYYRGFFARKHYHKIRSATIIIQQHCKATLVAKRQRNKYLELKKSCIQIQAYYRGYIARRNYLAKKNATIIIQQHLKTTILARKQRTEFLKLKMSCSIIQSYYRGHSARQKYLRTRKAAIVIQRHWNATILAKKQRVKYLDLRESCLKIQSFYRGHVARQYCNLLRIQATEKRRNEAATLIQSIWRAHSRRTKFLHLKMAAITIQSWYKAKKAKQNYLKVKNAALTIQLKWKSTLHGRKVQNDFKTLKSSAIKIQALRRKTVERRRFLATKHATVIIQTFVRGWMARKQCKAAKLTLQQKKTAAVCIQSAWRCFKARCHFIKIRTAAVIIQQHWKATILEKIQRTKFLQLKISCLLIQSYYRRHKARQQFLIYLQQKNEETRRRKAATSIQSAWRGHIERMEFLHKKKAAVTIQTWYKGVKDRQNYLTVCKANVTIQLKWKATLQAWRIRREFKTLKSTVVRLQALRRKIVQRRKFLAVKKATVTIQALFRGWMEKTTYTATKNAAIKIQAYFRCIIVRRSYLEKRRAVVSVQRQWRAKQLTTSTRAEFLKQKQAVIQIQAIYRGNIARKRFKVMQEEANREKSAIVLQSWFRGCRQRRSYALLLEEKAAKRKLQLLMISMAVKDHLNAIIIQRAYRRAVVRAHHKQHIQLVVKVQRKWKSKLMRRKFQKMRKAAVVIQRHFRRHLLHQQERAILIQRRWRMYLTRKKVQSENRASLLIQSAWRGFTVRKSMLVFPGIAYQRLKIQEASKRASLHPENTIHNRMVQALRILFSKKYLNQVRSALEELERVSELVGVCCDHITEAGGPKALFRLFSVCNRDFGSGTIVLLSLRILTNLLSNPSSSESVKQTIDENLDELVNVFSKYQDRGGRDKSNRPVFISACELLLIYLGDERRAKDFVINHQLNIQRLKNIQKETERRYKTQNERSSIQRRMTELHTIKYLNDSSMMTEQSFVKERSFVKGMFTTLASTSTPSRSQAPKLPEATTKPKTTTRKPKVKPPLVKQPAQVGKAQSRPKMAPSARPGLPRCRTDALKPTENVAGTHRRRSVQPVKTTEVKSASMSPDLVEDALYKLNKICEIFEVCK